jgi:cytosine deaminase
MVAVRNAGRRRDWKDLILVSTLSPCSMCAGAAILYKIPKVIIGENRTFQGAEHWMAQNGIELHVLNDERAIALMERLQQQRAELWAEDIGE